MSPEQCKVLLRTGQMLEPQEAPSEASVLGLVQVATRPHRQHARPNNCCRKSWGARLVGESNPGEGSASSVKSAPSSEVGLLETVWDWMERRVREGQLQSLAKGQARESARKVLHCEVCTHGRQLPEELRDVCISGPLNPSLGLKAEKPQTPLSMGFSKQES